MPYNVTKQGSKWVVKKRGTDKVLGRHDSREQAERQLAALYANEKKGKK